MNTTLRDLNDYETKDTSKIYNRLRIFMIYIFKSIRYISLEMKYVRHSVSKGRDITLRNMQEHAIGNQVLINRCASLKELCRFSIRNFKGQSVSIFSTHCLKLNQKREWRVINIARKLRIFIF